MTLADGIFIPPNPSIIVNLGFTDALFYPARIINVEKYAGSAVGRARLAFPTAFASSVTADMGDRAKILLDGEVIFRGVVAAVPLEIDRGTDRIELILADDKWPMMRYIVGQYGIGTITLTDDPIFSKSGFTDVGHEIIFNKDGKPNKMPDEKDFSTAEDAEFWTLKDCMEFIFEYYVDPDDVALDVGELDGDYDRVVNHLAANGMVAPQVVDMISQLAGQSWGIKPEASRSKFIAVKRDGNSTRTIRLFTPRGGAKITQANTWTAGRISCDATIQNVRDVHQVKSGSIVKEHTYSNVATPGEVEVPPLLTRIEGFKDKKFVTRFAVDVTKYALNFLGANYQAGAKPKPWQPKLVTRLQPDGTAYVTAPELASTPSLAFATRAEIPVWVAPSDKVLANARLAVGGYDIDVENGLIDFEAKVEFLKSDGTKEQVAVTWASAGVWLTVATVLEQPQYAQSDTDSDYLPDSFWNVIEKSDLVPERRRAALLPDLANSSVDARVEISAAEDELYVDVSDQLDAELEAALRWMPEIETPLSIKLPFMPIAEIGDRVAISGRNIRATGDEVITEITYGIDREYCTEIRATNVMAGIDASQMAEARR